MKQIQDKIRFTSLTAFTRLATLAAVMLLVAGCSKEPQAEGSGGSSATGKMVSVTLPIGFGDAATANTQTTAKGGAVAPTTKAANSTEDGFTVSFGDEALASVKGKAKVEAATTATARTVAQELSNVWVLQFDKDGANVSTTNTGTLAASAYLTAPALAVGDGYTIYVVANGIASGLSTTGPATLAELETTMLPDATTDAATLTLSGKLVGVSVVDLGDGKGKLKLMDASPLTLMLTRIHAEVTLSVDFDVTGYALTGAELYNVPVGATYGWNRATTTFPANTVAANFGYTSTSAAGMASLTPTTDGTKTTYKWFTGDNRRGDVAGLTAQSDRNSTKAPAYSTFARVTLTYNTESTQKIYYDIYLGSGSVTNFDIQRNHTYTSTAAIKGTAEFHEALVGADGRVSGAGIPIYLTDSKADSPIIISPKNTESTTSLIWGPTTSISISQNIFNGKANTDAIMATSPTAYPATKYCRDQGAKYYLPSQAELMLIWIYLPAIPVADRPASGYFWSSTELSSATSAAWRVNFSTGYTTNGGKSNDDYVRCVRKL